LRENCEVFGEIFSPIYFSHTSFVGTSCIAFDSWESHKERCFNVYIYIYIYIYIYREREREREGNMKKKKILKNEENKERDIEQKALFEKNNK
jgi:hypothetical protein